MITDAIEYDRESGLFRWLIKPSSNVEKGDVAGTTSEGYTCIMYKRRSYKAHRIAWEVENGEIPKDMEVDHINHLRSDNRIENLRLVSKSENLKNKSEYNNNKSGVTGVSWHKKRMKWVSQIQCNGVKKMLYEGDSFDIAVSARKKAEAELRFHKNHGG